MIIDHDLIINFLSIRNCSVCINAAYFILLSVILGVQEGNFRQRTLLERLQLQALFLAWFQT